MRTTYKKQILAACLCLIAGVSFAEDAKEGCKKEAKNVEEKITTSVSLHFSDALDKEENPNEIYDNKTAQVEAFGRKLKLANYRVVSKALTFGRAYNRDNGYDLSMSYTVEYDSDQTIVKEIIEELSLQNGSMSTYQSACGSCGC